MTASTSAPAPERAPVRKRKFLCVVDASDECAAAVHFAARRAANTGGHVALLFVVEPEEYQHWSAVKDIMLEESREEAQDVLTKFADKVQQVTGGPAELIIREGKIREQINALVSEDREIGVLVLGAATGKDGPGPLVSALAGRDQAGRFPLPVTVVPGNLSDEEIDALA
ncbi:MAG: universal stress protein [Alphaproteobacteria bacterium]|nr:MAG: universal stress protein [Alphaproteobacteria bacterium]